ncbi:MAG: hypothetical protein ACI4SR_10465 [Faecalibacillus sp.]
MEKILPPLNDDPTVQEYMKTLLNHDKQKEYYDMEELLDYFFSDGQAYRKYDH